MHYCALRAEAGACYADFSHAENRICLSMVVPLILIPPSRIPTDDLTSGLSFPRPLAGGSRDEVATNLLTTAITLGSRPGAVRGWAGSREPHRSMDFALHIEAKGAECTNYRDRPALLSASLTT